MKTPLIILSVVVLAVVGWLLISNTGQHQNMAPTSATTQAEPSAQSDNVPNFHLQDYSGKTMNLSDFAGKPLIINSWATWCPFCRQELADFATAQKEFGDKVTVIAIDRVESSDTARKYTDQQGTTDKLIFLLDPTDSFYQSIGGFSMPETVFVDTNGKIVDHKRGPMGLNEIRERAQKILAGASTVHGAPTTTQSIPAPIEQIVTYRESGFSPATLRVKVGTTVVFKNEESEPMWVASNPHPIHTDYPGFDAKRGYAQGESYSFTFTKPGSWKYHNHLGPSEGGTIIVE